jgi:Na+/H+-dicarboxylate symporter
MGVGLVAGLMLGLMAAARADAGYPALVNTVQLLRPIGTLFLNLLQMVVIPLVATALFAGIAKLGNLRSVGRLLVRTLAFFWGTALAAIVIGFAVGSLVLPLGQITPEQQAALRAVAVADTSTIQKTAESIPTGTRFIVDLIPANPIRAAVDGNLLAVIVFVTFFAVAAAGLPEDKRATLTDLADAATTVLIRIVHWVLLLAPLGIFALVAPIVAKVGWGVVKAMGVYVLAVGLGVGVFIAVVYLPAAALLARIPPLRFLKAAFPSWLMGFSTTSSMATLPTMLETATGELKLPSPIASFALPLAASMNRGGSALFQAVAILFVAQLYGVPLGFGDLFKAGIAVFLASLTVAAVPSGSVVSLWPAFAATSLPIQGISLLMGLDRIPDMLRTSTNVIGHLTGASVISAVETARRRDA